ncbi:MAG: UDP-N-acetylmuramoyl-L-alanyl-D-glutamate--2,6-diaminopimelate ligase, partial [Bacteroidales bacterium]|nr:UDP-N-acetylmuramoyl-L-alanyl-D-glutamate--2,6-diaminopimelate ligase [Bacteroidales bacterium]
MKKLSKILAGIETGYSEEELQNLEITSVTFDSRKVDDGCLFVAIKGTSVDGHKYINNAVEGGARV